MTVKNTELETEINSNDLLIYKCQTQGPSSYNKKFYHSPDNIYPIKSNKNFQVNTLNINSNTNNIININNNISSKHYIMSPAYNKKFIKNNLCSNTPIFRSKKKHFTITNKVQDSENNLEKILYSTITGTNNTNDDRYETNDDNSKTVIFNEKKKFINKPMNRNAINFVYSNKLVKRDIINNTSVEPEISSKTKNSYSNSNDTLINIYKEKLLKIFVRFVKNYCIEYSKNFYSDFFYGLKNYLYKKRINSKKLHKNSVNDFYVKSSISKNDNYNHEETKSYYSKKINKAQNNQKSPLGTLVYTATSPDQNTKKFKSTKEKIENDDDFYKKISNTITSNKKKIPKKTENKINNINQSRRTKSNIFSNVEKNKYQIESNYTINPYIIYNNERKQKKICSNKNYSENKNLIFNDLDYFDSNSISNSGANSNYHSSYRKPKKNFIYNIENNNNVLNNLKNNNCAIEKLVYKKGNSTDVIIKENKNEMVKNKSSIFNAYKKSKDNFFNIKKLKNKISIKINNNSSMSINKCELNTEMSNNFCLEDLDKPLDNIYLKSNSYLNTENITEEDEIIKYRKMSVKNIKDIVSSDKLLFIHINYVYYDAKKIYKKKIGHKNPIMAFDQKYFRMYNLYSFSILGKKKKYLYINNPIDEDIEYDENNPNNDDEEGNVTLNLVKNKKIKNLIIEIENIINNQIFEYKILFINFLKKLKFKSIIYNILKTKKIDTLKKYFDIYKNKTTKQRISRIEIEDIDSDLDDNDFIINNIDNNVMNEDFEMDIDDNYNTNYNKQYNCVIEKNINNDQKRLFKTTSFNGNKVYSKKKVKSNKNNENNDIIAEKKVHYINKFEEFIEVFRLVLINFVFHSNKNK